MVAKPETSPYRCGERGWIKVKHLRTVDCVVGGYRKDLKIEAVASLLLGLHSADGVLHHVGHTSSFSERERRDLLEALRPLEGGTSFGAGRTPADPPAGPGGVTRTGWRCARSWSARSPSTTCREIASATRRGSSTGAPTRRRTNAGTQLLPPHPFDLTGIVDIGAG